MAQTITISVPAGTTQHNDPNILCFPTTNYQFVLFYLLNYIAHAASTRPLPGQTTFYSFVEVLTALFFPFAGVVRGLETLLSFVIWRRRDQGPLQLAAQAGALCVVVKKPPHPATLPEKLNLFAGGMYPVLGTDWNFHGSFDLFEANYTIALLPPNAMVVPFPTTHAGGFYNNEDAMSNNYNIARAMAGIVQAVFGIITLYRPADRELEQYGYASFSLTVLPYIVMSIVNLFANLLMPGYPRLFLVESDEMNQARAAGCEFHGTVGRLVQFPPGAGVVMPFLNDFALYETHSFASLQPRIAVFFAIILAAIPYAVIGGLTSFKKEQSTLSERAWTMTWLAFDVAYGIALPFFIRHVFGVWGNNALATRYPTGSGLRSSTTARHRKFFMCLFITITLPLFTPAIGGWVVVRQMLKQYGVCRSLN